MPQLSGNGIGVPSQVAGWIVAVKYFGKIVQSVARFVQPMP
jgi:hypothetical protein